MRVSASEFILFCNPPRDNVERLSKIVPEVELMIDGDSHRPIGRGTIPWDDVFAAMRQLPEDVLYVMEYAAAPRWTRSSAAAPCWRKSWGNSVRGTVLLRTG
jgi:hypothetical protein